MKKLIVFIIVGFFAQLIDGSLGMAYGVTSTSLLLAFGIAPAIASASVHLAEVVTTAASGVSHIKFGNVDKNIIKSMTIPGAIGAFIGACFLSNISGDIVKPYIAIFLFLLGIYIIYRFVYKKVSQSAPAKPFTKKRLVPLALVAGFADATGGGGWGPISTPVLLAHKGTETRKIIGSVDTTEFAVSLAATIGFFISLGWQDVNWFWVGTLMAGGLVAAPIAAWLVKIIPSHFLGILVGGCILLTNSRTVVHSIGLSSAGIYTIYAGVFVFWFVSLIYLLQKRKRQVFHEVSNSNS
ncbi:sulfite exporter TauE/SafE family protein [Priestia koreensis]|uniref:sulfite exporter TauE/SafE family protein n=1 Tax=Priestia koreensis TaxID=284581 RepID=UPI003457663C